MQSLIAELSSLTWNDAYNALCVVAVALVSAWVLGMAIVIQHVYRSETRQHKQEEI